MKPEIKILEQPHDVAMEVTSMVHQIIHALDTKDKVFILLSGGKTPKIMFQELAKSYKEKLPWEKIHLFWADERCVPNNHDESNYNLAKKNLLNLVDIPHENVHRIIGENQPNLESKRYASEIKKHVPDLDGWPRFDIALLGMGDDGHTASIFPNRMELLNTDEICVDVRHPRTGQQRVTVTGKLLNNAENIIFMVTGVSKAAVIAMIVFKAYLSKELPSSFIFPVKGKLSWILDQEAGMLIKNMKS